MREDPDEKLKDLPQDANGINGDLAGKDSDKHSAGGAGQIYSNPVYSDETTKPLGTNGTNVSTQAYPLQDMDGGQSKSAQKDPAETAPASQQNRESGLMKDYYSKVVDAEFGFIDNDLYSGGLYPS